MRTAILALAAVFGLAGSALSAQAAPPAPATHSPAIVNIAGGCGYGWHPTRWGECVPYRYRMHRARPYTEDYIEEWDEYDSY